MDKELKARIAPESMAEIYFLRMQFRAVSAIIEILKQHPIESDTGKYWRETLRFVRSKIDGMNKGKALSAGTKKNH